MINGCRVVLKYKSIAYLRLCVYVILELFLYLHREYRYKDNVSMVENGTMVSAYNTKSFVFLSERSVGDPAVDNITTVNIPAWVSHELKVKKSGNPSGGRVTVCSHCSWTLFIVSSSHHHLPYPALLELCFFPHHCFPSCLQAVMNKVKGSFWRASMVSIWMNSIGSGLFTTRTVDELLWGYEDPLLTRVAASSPEVEKVFGLMYKACTVK